MHKAADPFTHRRAKTKGECPLWVVSGHSEGATIAEIND